MVARKVSTATHFFLHVSHHQFSLEDSENAGQSFTFDALDEGLEAQRHGVVTHLRRAAGRIPLVVEVRGEPPPADFDAFHLVTEGSFEAPSGQLEVASPEATWQGSISVPAGWLRVQVRQADLDTSAYDGSDGADHYRVIIWPAPAAKTKVLLSRDVKDGVPFKAKLKLAQLQKDLTSLNPTVRCLAVNEAARHLRAGEKKALALLRAATTDESDAVRAVTLSALAMTGTSQRASVLELISTKVGDRDAEVRERVPEALSRLGGKEGAAALVALLSNKDGELAKQSAQLLWTVTEHLEADDLVPTLESKKAETRLAALNAVKTLGEGRGWESVASVSALVRGLTKDKNPAVKELAVFLVEKLGAPLSDLLELAKGSTEQRESAATSLGKSRAPEASLLKLLEQVAAQVDLKRPGNRTLVFERARLWLAMGRLAEAREDLRQLVKEGFPVVAVEHLAALLLHEPLSAKPAAPEDALDALVLGLFALREGQFQDASKRLLDARSKGISRQLFSTPGMMARAVAGAPAPLASACDRFAKDWDAALTRGDVAATDRAIEALAAAAQAARSN